MYKTLLVEEHEQLRERYRQEARGLARRTWHIDIAGSKNELIGFLGPGGPAYNGILIDQHYYRRYKNRKLPLSEFAMKHLANLEGVHDIILVVSKHQEVIQEAKKIGLQAYWISDSNHHKQEKLENLLDRLRVHCPKQ